VVGIGERRFGEWGVGSGEWGVTLLKQTALVRETLHTPS
jgi:hypothetical protein